MQDNNTDCLRAMYLQSRQDIRQLDKAKKPRDNSDDEISKLIDSFFLKSEDGNPLSTDVRKGLIRPTIQHQISQLFQNQIKKLIL